MEKEIYVRRAGKKDLSAILALRRELAQLHHEKRPDLFRTPKKMRFFFRMKKLLLEETPPVIVAANRENKVLGYLWYSVYVYRNHDTMRDIKGIHIEDICVTKECRRSHIGEKLYQWVKEYGQEQHCEIMTLDVWAANREAVLFYEACGFTPQILRMEQKIEHSKSRISVGDLDPH
ncbi:MAG: GNAT family N-acetyltransferase [Eubacteriales bacterium]|nr:GNAT family N-acetyltransferase [Eubacteriales bacterium]